MRPPVVVDQVHKSYGSLKVLKGVSLTVEQGEVACLIGPSGSGKSTLLRCLNLLEDIDSGAVWVNGELLGRRVGGDRQHRLDDGRIRQQRQGIGMVFQHFNLFPHLTALENVTLAPTLRRGADRAEVRRRAEDLLAAVGLADKRLHHPAQLSGGQQQRVAIARALALEPAVLLFDEPTSALDPEVVGEVLAVMSDLAGQGMTMIVVTHELTFAREAADTIHFMDGGTIIESGPPETVLDRPEQARTIEFLRRFTR
ncbi:amino acid ABC transporter ATP-binding protein, PAAT family [Propionibacteriaceae bacterium ES.041]|uniref:amino acid ABC transporter ATP-binding protein n=1 Tax=Enemella evansiae TaxID=2016499 RepID=UPI000B977890|nr:amino acid ABC transporter ATP-binding protein [Enemella evansiae]OYO04654.1 ectoine/hydroxyectoine ABC transporter ATP-binding protein EhuA [Enemella evansiae]PFG66028.1 amino acid ABC transporter ATP-binding protein, PAAT family [Propionibacteriaceae bacterium ES.041]TDO85317.1 polar amino acid transport system ATP-binding protein [Enemella evansiae]